MTFLLKVTRFVRRSSLTEKIWDVEDLGWKEIWSVIWRLTRANQTCPYIKKLPVMYFRAAKSSPSVDLNILRENLDPMMSTEEKEMFERIVGRQVSIRELMKPNTLILVPAMSACAAICDKVRFLGDNPVYFGIEVFGVCMCLVMILKILRALA